MDTKIYDAIWIENASMNDSWHLWFDPDLDSDIFPADWIYSPDAVEQMIEGGITYWSHPGWISDVGCLLKEWAIAGNLIRVRLTTEWLLSTLPDHFIDPDFGIQLYWLSTGHFCEVYTGEACIRMRLPEFYLMHLQWAIAGVAQNFLDYDLLGGPIPCPWESDRP